MSNRTVMDAILGGEHDAQLGAIESAVAMRKRHVFRRGAKVRIMGATHGELNGQIGTVVRVNPKRIAVVLEDGKEWGVPMSMLEVLQ